MMISIWLTDQSVINRNWGCRRLSEIPKENPDYWQTEARAVHYLENKN